MFWGLLIKCNNFHFLFFLQFWHLILTEVWGCLDFLGPFWAFFLLNVGLKNCFVVHSCSLTTFIFYDSLNSDIWIWLTFAVIFVVYSCSCSNFILYVSVNSGIGFYLILGSFWLIGAIMGYFWGRGRVQKLFWGLLMHFFNFYFVCFRQFWYWFLLNLGVIFYFLGS